MFNQAKIKENLCNNKRQYPNRSPLSNREKQYSKMVMNSNKVKREDCQKFTMLLKEKSYGSADKSKVHTTFSGLLKKAVNKADTERKEVKAFA